MWRKFLGLVSIPVGIPLLLSVGSVGLLTMGILYVAIRVGDVFF